MSISRIIDLRNIKGSLMVEAAIFLPVFIIGILTLTYIVKANGIQENVFHSFNDETRKIAAEASISPYPAFYKNDVLKRVREENGKTIENAAIKSFKYRIPTMESTDVIGVSLEYDVKIGLPIKIVDKIPVNDTIVCRAFVGYEQANDPMSFSEMEETGDSKQVWVFPRSGTKYHEENCGYIANEPREKMLLPAIRNQYKPCKLCKPGELSDGNMVYCFKTGSVYHRGSCTTVDKYVTSIGEDEARQKSYMPCSKCGGG